MQRKKSKTNTGKTSLKYLVMASVFGLAAFIASYYAVRAPQLELPYLTARNIAVLDMESGDFVYDLEGDAQHSPASITKLMTLCIVLDDIKNGALSWDDIYTATPDEAFTMGSKYGMNPGETFTVRQLVAGTAMASGCDCVQCLVKLCAADEAAFVTRMNEKAREIGLSDTSFANATGIDSADHYMTARDIANLGRYLIETHPEILDFTSVPTLEIEGRTFQNVNRLVGRDTRVKGLKTGTTQIGGNNLVTYAEQNGRECIVVLLDSSSDATRFSETVTVLDVFFGES